MEQRLSDLLSDALSEMSSPSFPGGDFDFENLNFDEKFEEGETDISNENVPTKEDTALHQEGTGETTVLSNMETKDTYMTENVEQSDDDNDKEDFQGVGVSLMSMDRTPEDYTSSDGDSEQEGSASGEDEEDDDEEDMGPGEEPGDLVMSHICCDEFCCGNKEDRIFAEGQPLAPEGAENPQVRNEDQGENESDEEESYFGRVPEHGDEMMIKSDGIEEGEREREEDKQDDSSDSECEGVKVEQEENVLAQCFEQGECPLSSLEFPEISVQSLQDLVVEVDGEENVEKMKEFSGEEHEEAGESFADYPSDFSSCEYVEDGLKNQESNPQSSVLSHTSNSSSNTKQVVPLEGAVTDVTWMGTEEDTDEQGDEYLYSRDLEMDADKFVSFDVAVGKTWCDDEGETGETDSNSSSDDEVQVRRRDEELFENMYPQDLENDNKLEEAWLYSTSSAAFSRWSMSNDDDMKNNREHPADFSIDWDFNVSKTTSFLSDDLLTAEDTDEAETPLSGVSQCPAGYINSYSVVQGDDKATSPSYQGSVDDSFFFNTELEVTELGQLGDDEREEERNWEQEQERIDAFFKFYNDSEGENEREERQIKVQFCADPLSQVIHYESDSSDSDSLSSSTDGEEDLSSAETSEEMREPDETLQTMPGCDSPNAELPEILPEENHCNTQICSRKHKCLSMLKLILKMGVVVGMGLLVFWLATDQPEWLSRASISQR